MRVLITGGCGFLGSNLAEHAMDRGDELAVLDNLYRVGSQKNLDWLREKGRFLFFRSDVRHLEDTAKIMKEFSPHAVIHLAGQVAMTTSIDDPRMDFEVNALGTLNILEAARQHIPDAAIVYSSTNKVYGDLEQFTYRETETRYECVEYPRGFNESVPLNFHSPYGCSKGSADQYMLDYARIYGLNTAVLRHSSIYGGRQFATYDQGWIGWFCLKALEARRAGAKDPFTISGTGKQVRDVLHVQDAVRLYFGAVDRVQKVRGEAFNIGGGISNSLSLLELFHLLEKEVGCRMRYVKIPPRSSDQRVFVADCKKIKRALGWEAEIDKGEGIKKMINWIEYGR